MHFGFSTFLAILSASPNSPVEYDITEKSYLYQYLGVLALKYIWDFDDIWKLQNKVLSRKLEHKISFIE